MNSQRINKICRIKKQQQRNTKTMNKIMKKTILATVLALGLAGMSMTLTGCASSPAAQAVEQTVVTSGAAAGTYLVLKNNPAHAAQYAADFTAGAAVLNQVAGNTNSALTPATIQPVLNQL